MAFIALVRPHALLLATAVLLDLLLGDPAYPLHPIRLMGRSLTWFENRLRQISADGYAGGIVLFLLLSAVWVGGSAVIVFGLHKWNGIAVAVFHVFLIYSCLALRDLLRHVWAVESAARRVDLTGARVAIAQLVGRDTDRMDIAACRRAAIESLSENLTDGFISPLAWYAVLGLPGIVLFKVVSTMDSMVGYKTARYFQFGWCGARLDDVMNFIPARSAWLLLSIVSVVIPGCSATKAFRVGIKQHGVLPGPNSGWSEAATAGAIQRRLIGPIWANGVLVTDIWIGEPADPPAGGSHDIPRTAILVGSAGLLAATFAILVAAWI